MATDVSEEKQRRKNKGYANLIPFKKGQSGNPAGRPKGSISIVGRIKQIFEEDPKRFESYVQEILKDKNMYKPITEHIDGKPIQPISNADGTPFVVQVMKYGDDNTAA